MTQEQLGKANYLASKIQQFESALCCFEWEYEPGQFHDLTPRLIIDFDDCDGGRDQVQIPINLNKSLIDFLKDEIKTGLAQAQKEFENL